MYELTEQIKREKNSKYIFFKKLRNLKNVLLFTT